ncbi:hypothetical protein [Neolewinella persica]|uniref:hypothetical protein n=1 Tax=Neolewinella persica TaxID=70998 RepID=UPI00036EC512|nr:hypothetical protein [Neolewinella persica]
MDVYNANDQGIPLSAKEVAGLNLSAGTLEGFFHRGKIEEMLSQPDIVGIRVYTSDASGHLALGVKADGFETEVVWQSRSPNRDNKIIPLGIDKLEARLNVSRGPKLVTAFFSADMLRACLNVPDTLGISFHVVPISSIDDARFSAPELVNVKNGRSTLSTFLAIPTALEADGTVPVNGINTGGVVLLSDKPCPGYCGDNGSAEATDDGRYLRPWN